MLLQDSWGDRLHLWVAGKTSGWFFGRVGARPLLDAHLNFQHSTPQMSVSTLVALYFKAFSPFSLLLSFLPSPFASLLFLTLQLTTLM